MAKVRLPRSVQELADWYMRYVSPLSLIAGVIADNLFLARRVDLLLTNALLFTYLTIAALSIFVINLVQTGRWRNPLLLKVFPLMFVVAQFAFGGLFSAYFSLYSRSAAISATWIFVLALVVLIIGNERFAHFYARFTVQIGIYFTVLFSFLIFFLPLITHQIAVWMFIVSGALALALTALLLKGIFWLMPEMREKRTAVARSVAIIYIAFNALYFTGLIPPLPLALKDAGVYHAVSRDSSGDYVLKEEPVPWYDIFARYNTTYHKQVGESAYVFTSIFAPSGLTVIVLHEWQHYDEASGTWNTVASIAFPIHGGADGGYRGYSLKSNPAPGKWRVNVVTQSGLLIGRVSFEVVSSASAPPVRTVVK